MTKVIKAELWTVDPEAGKVLDEHWPEWRQSDLFTKHNVQMSISDFELASLAEPKREIERRLKSALAHDVTDRAPTLLTEETLTL